MYSSTIFKDDQFCYRKIDVIKYKEQYNFTF